jgi:phosphoserine aminotransferase
VVYRNVPKKNYKILFQQGGGCTQFASVPLNLMGVGSAGVADYLVTGNWSKNASDEATKYGRVHIATNSGGNYTNIAARETWTLTEGASYVHYCANETVHGKKSWSPYNTTP